MEIVPIVSKPVPSSVCPNGPIYSHTLRCWWLDFVSVSSLLYTSSITNTPRLILLSQYLLLEYRLTLTLPPSLPRPTKTLQRTFRFLPTRASLG